MPRLLFFGDYHVYGPYDAHMRANSGYQPFDDNLVELVKSSDLSFFNLEDPVTTGDTPLPKFGPYGWGSPVTLDPLEAAGFHVATFATNHTWDFRRKGLEETFSACEAHNLRVIGAGFTLDEARRIPWFEVDGKRLAVLNYARSEFSAANRTHGGANPLDIIQISRDIRAAKAETDTVIVVLHAGVDTCPYPSPEMVRQARFIVEQGASAVIYHHARVVSGWEVYEGAPIFYGLGNLLHLTRHSSNRIEHEGLGVSLSIEDDGLRFELHPVQLHHADIRVKLLQGEEKDVFMAKLEKLNEIIGDEEKLLQQWRKWIDEKFRTVYLMQLTGFPRLVYRVARKLKMLPLISKLLVRQRKRILPIWNTTRCETHFEALDDILNRAYYDNN